MLERGPVRLVDVEGPLEDVEFPDGNKYAVVPFGPAEHAKWRALHEKWDSQIALELLQHTVPDAPIEAFDLLSPKMMHVLLQHAQYKIDIIMLALKNLEAGKAVGMTSRRSKRRTRKAT